MDTVSAAAKKIVQIMQHSFQAPLTYLPVDEREFSHLHLADYHECKSFLETAGFRYIADMEVLEVSNAPYSVIARTFVRSMVSNDGSIVAGYYQIRPRMRQVTVNLVRGLLGFQFISAPLMFLHMLSTKHCQDFETEFSDGSFIITSNAQAAESVTSPPNIAAEYFAYNTPCQELLARHRDKVSEKLRADPLVSCYLAHSYNDIVACQQRMKAVKNAYRATLNWVTQDEIMKMSGGNAELADAVFVEVQKILQEQAAKK